MKYNALKGVHDIFPPDIYIWQNVEKIARDIFSVYGFQELRTPIIESTDIFIRSIGETTDIVEKEMYTFSDRETGGLLCGRRAQRLLSGAILKIISTTFLLRRNSFTQARCSDTKGHRQAVSGSSSR
jgi:hypothetical protein